MRSISLLDRNTHWVPGMNKTQRAELIQAMKALKFGIEIEVVGITQVKIATTVAAALGGRIDHFNRTAVIDQQGRTWKAVHDGSLSGSANGELVTPILTYSDLGPLQAVVRALREAGARVDASTGQHIHIGAEGFDAAALTRFIKLVHKQERLLEQALGTQEHRLVRYCRPISQDVMQRIDAKTPKTIEDVKTAWYGYPNAFAERYSQTRYHGVNLNSYFYRRTIEIRAFEGTLHAGEVKANVQFCLALAAKALVSKSASAKRRDVDASGTKFQFRVFLLSLGLIGEEFKTARLHLLKRLNGSAAWKGERQDKDRRRAPSVTPPQEPTPQGE